MILELSLHLLLIVCAALIFTPRFSVLNQSIPIDSHYQKAALKPVSKTIPFILLLTLTAKITHEVYLLVFLILPIILLAIPVVARKYWHSLLAIEISIIHPQQVRIHLSTIDQVFNRAAFVELLQLTELLKKKEITTITLSSPLFFKGRYTMA